MSSIVEQVGRVIGGRYRLLAVVGAGASAQVFAADDARLSRRVAVKLLHPALAGDTTFLRKFQAEARLAASLNHRNVLHVYDWGDEDGVPYLVLEYLGGGSLRSLLDTGYRLSPSQAAAVGAEAANGLAYAHRRGLVHRDIKPANLLFDDDGRLLVADFGLARALAEAAITEPLGAVVGTARYASPEQVEGRPVDDRTDVYSLALTLYEAVTGRVPFAGETTVATLMARVGAVLPPARELGPLAPVLAQAAISEPLARLDAAGLAYELELLLLELDAPGPLPLAKAYVAVPSESRAFERDPTERFVLPAHEPSAAGLAEQSAPAEEPTPPAAPPASEIALAAVDPVESEPVRAWSIEADDDLDDIDELIGFGLATEGQAPPAPSGPSAPAAVPSDVVEDSVDLVEVAGTAGIEQVSAPRTEQQPLPSASTPSPEDVGALSSPPAASSPTPSPSEPPGGASAGSLARDALTGDKAAGDKEPPSALPAPAPRAPEASTASVVNAPQKAPAPPEAESLPAPLRKGPVPAPAPVLSPLPGDPVSVPNGAPAAAAPRAEAARTQLASRPEDLAGVRRVITAPVPEPPPRRRKNRWLPWLLVVLLAEMGAGAGFLASRSHPVARDTVPFVTGLQYSSARATILRTGLYPELVGEQYSGSVPTGSVISQDPSRGVREKAGDIVRYVISQGRHPTAVPSLSGMSEEKATAALLGAHLVPRISELYSETVAAGTVLTWRSLAGRRVFYGDAVEVVLSKGPSPQTIPVDLAGGVRTWTQAESALTDLHLVAVENPRYSTTIPAGFVVTTQPAPGTTVPGHSRVLVLVSEGPPFETIPAILGGSVSAAEQALASLGLKWQLFGPAGASTVLTTLPRVGQSVRYGTTVSIYLY